MMETVLIVDDEPDLRSLLRAFLENKGFDCLEASNGHRALQTLHAHGEIDLLLTDYRMPGMDGLELLRSMRLHPLHCHIPVILVTAEQSLSLRNKAFQAGVNKVMSKPYDFVELKYYVHQFLEPRLAS